MRGAGRSVLCFAAVASFSLLIAGGARGQDAAAPKPPPAPSETQPSDPNSLAAIVLQLQSQVQKLSAQLDSVRVEEEETREEARELRKELDDANSRLAALTASAADPPSTHPASGSTEQTLTQAGGSQPQDDSSQRNADEIARLEEDQQLNSAELKEQSQTKVESGSKYRLRLSGILLVNLFSNRGSLDNEDFPAIAEPEDFLGTNSSIGGSLRQSQITLQAFGPDVAGARTSADVSFDFAGGAVDAPNGAVMGVARLRTGMVRFDWANTSIIVGQDTLFISPLSPTSFATIAYPPLSYAGNLWSWAPQIRVEHRFNFTSASKVVVQGAILDPLTGDIPYEYYSRDPSWGEQSGLPAFAGRVSWSHLVQDQTLTLGFSGYYGEQDWGFGRDVDSWATVVDVTMPLGEKFSWTGEFYRGTALGGLGGGIGQSVLWNGDLGEPSTEVEGLDSMGGWTQIKFRATQKIQLNAALGDDNPFASELREYSGNTGYYGELLSRNLSPFFNVIYQPRSDTVLSLEYQRLKTYTLDSAASTANHVDLSMGYIF